MEATLRWRCMHRRRLDASGRRVLVPSRLTMLVVRVIYVAILTAIAAAFPYITPVRWPSCQLGWAAWGEVGALG